MLTILKRLALWCQIYALDITINGQTEALDCVGDPMTKMRIERARHIARGERTRLRCALDSTYPVGVRRIWKTA